MTTVVTDGKRMIGDCQLTDSGLIFNYQDKIRKINGNLVAGAGNPDDVALFLAWYENPTTKPPRLTNNFEGMVVNPAGSIFYYTRRLIPQQVHEKVYAIGSGSSLALGALDAGASLADAMKIACKRDIYTGVGLVEIELDGQRDKLQKKPRVRAGSRVRKKQGRKS